MDKFVLFTDGELEVVAQALIELGSFGCHGADVLYESARDEQMRRHETRQFTTTSDERLAAR